MADMIAGMQGAFAVMTAIREVEMKDGNGQVIDLSLLEPIFSIMGAEAAWHQLTGTFGSAPVAVQQPRRPATFTRPKTTSGWRCLARCSLWLNASLE